MAGQDKTEEPTGKRLGEARRRGQIAMSRDLTMALGLGGLMGVFLLGGSWMLERYAELLREGLQLQPASDDALLLSRLATLFWQSLPLLVLPAAACGLVGILVGLLQTKFNFANEALKPSLDKINPLKGLQRLFGYRGLFEVGKELLKVSAVGLAVWIVLWPRRHDLAQLVGMPPLDIMSYLAELVLKLGFAVTLAYLALGLADLAFQRFSTKRELRMTREEVKQERRQTDLPPEIRRYLRRKQFEAGRARMLAAVPEADVVITNPTHYAVALAYSPDQPAPRVLASGMDLVAQQIRNRAEEAGVEILENPPLARALYSSCQPGDWVPENLYVAVAEVLAFVYRRRQQLGFSAQL